MQGVMQSLKILADSISVSDNLQNFLGDMPPDPLDLAHFACQNCFAQHGHLFYYLRS